MFKKYVIPVVIAALLTPNFAVLAEDEDLQNQLSDVQNRMAQESEKKAQAEAVIGSVNDRSIPSSSSSKRLSATTRPWPMS